ncbi:MAG TPA: DNA-directed RNA polymerase subunit alpha C-terminal domain-containing protein [Tepiditoga sp.]|nr:DNA-directed RNA polymerase subunit alpha C-terminal domain-containing protein [Tepiditoga sp.]
MKIKNFGKKSLDEIRKELKDKFDVDYDILFDERRSSN